MDRELITYACGWLNIIGFYFGGIYIAVAQENFLLGMLLLLIGLGITKILKEIEDKDNLKIIIKR